MSECDFCHYETETVNYDSQDRRQVKKLDLCSLCASTPAGLAAFKPWNYPNADILRTLSYVANKILDTVHDEQEPK